MMMRRLSSRRRRTAAYGFTLVEVMIVAAIIAILSAIAYPSYQEQVRKTRRAEAKAALMKTMQAQEKYYTQFNTYKAFTSATNLDGTPFRAFTAESAASSYYELTAAACGTSVIETIDACVKLTAKPGAAPGGPAFKDTKCGTLSLTSTGIKTATGTDRTKCWQ